MCQDSSVSSEVSADASMRAVRSKLFFSIGFFFNFFYCPKKK